MSFVPRVPAAAEGRSDAEDSNRCPRGTTFHPLEPATGSGAETACPCRRARLAGRLFHHGSWAALDHPAGADRRLRPGLRHGDVRERFDHRCPAVCPVLHPAFACPPRDREWISLHGAHRHPVDADLSGRVHAGWPAWRRAADHELALYSVACRFSDVRHRVCPIEGCRSSQGDVVGFRGCGHSFKCGHDCDRRVCGDVYRHSGGGALAPHHARSAPFFYPPALYCRISGPVERCCAHCALGPAAFSARYVADGGHVRVRDRDLSDRVYRYCPLQCGLVFRRGLRACVGWSRLVLFVLLYEIMPLYARVLRAFVAEQLEREARLMTGEALSASISQEVKQP